MKQKKEGLLSRIISPKVYIIVGCLWILVFLLIAVASRNNLYLITKSIFNLVVFFVMLSLLAVGVLYLLMGLGKIKTNIVSNWSLIFMLSPILVILLLVAFVKLQNPPLVGEVGLGLTFGAAYICAFLILIAFVLLIISLFVKKK